MASASFLSLSEEADDEEGNQSRPTVRNEVKKLTRKLHEAIKGKELFEKQYNVSQIENLRLSRENEDRLEEQCQRYEAKITELHSVIAELSKKLDGQRISIIREEDEESNQSGELHSQGSSNNNPLESCTDNEDGNEDLTHLMTSNKSTTASLKHFLSAKDAGEDSVGLSKCEVDSSEHTLQLTQIKEEVCLLRAENEALHVQISQQETELNKTKTALGGLREERDRLRRKVRELHGKLQNLQSQGSQGSQTGSPTRSRGSNVNSNPGECSPTHREEAPVTKIAERVKLKRVESGDRHISGSEISSLGVSSAKVVEHLVQHIQEESNTQEIFHAISSSGSQISDYKIREFEVETERLNSRIEHLKSQNDLLTLTLEESKTHCDRLSVLLGKYESNNTALQLVMNYNEQALETTELLLRLLETEIGLVVAKCHAAGMATLVRTCGDCDLKEEAAAILKHAQEKRKSVESLAKRFLQRLDRNFSNAAFTNCGDRPWEDLSSHSHTASTTSSNSSYDGDLTKADEQKLRDYVIQMKNEKALVKMTVTELESVPIDPTTREPSSSSDLQKLDLENAVLIQELMAMKEEKAELKAQVYLLEKDRAALQLRLNGREAQEQAYIAHIEQLKYEVKEQEITSEKYKDEGERSTWELDPAQCMEQSADLSQSLVEAFHREKKLKSRIQELVATLEKVNRNSELRHQQSSEFINDLKRANSALITAFEKSKKKYQSKIKKFDQQLVTQSERHASQVHLLRQKIGMLENQISHFPTKANETSL